MLRTRLKTRDHAAELFENVHGIILQDLLAGFTDMFQLQLDGDAEAWRSELP